jgi:hypothetical protein
MPGPNSPYTQLDADQVLKQAFEESQDRLRVDAQVTAVIGIVDVDISDTSDSIKIGDGSGDYLAINSDGSINARTVQLFTLPFDAITATYPTSTQEVYKSRVGGISGAVQQTVTVNYTDATKELILNVART